MTDKPILNIFQRINAVMKEVDYIQKGEKKVANQYRYCSHDQVSSALHGPMAKHGIVAVPTVVEMTQNGTMTIAKIQMTFVNIDNPQDWFSVAYTGYGIDSGDKGPGKAISYACKYAMLKTFCLETGDDPDHDQEVKVDAVHPAMKKKAATDDECHKFFEDHASEKGKLVDYVMAVTKSQNKTMNEIIQLFLDDYENKMKSYKAWKEKPSA
ncbi:MAG TPA: ERF family protein [Candidatus Sulfotelmatobacter sp.]|jgi:hypothetical protein|nr:ERF family protein [Candidatus Sulfotelmatobacter sp.]